VQEKKILLIEDDELAAEIINDYLGECGFHVTSVFNATEAIISIKQNHFDVAILDINLPDFNGLEVLKSIKNFIALPIIVTSAYSDTKSKVTAFKYGARDYMVKPLDLEELEARIWVQLSQHSAIKTQEEKHLFSIKENTIFYKSIPLTLTTIEFEILSLLIKYKNKIILREELLETLSTLSSNRSLDNHIKNIRKKIGDNGNNAKILKTEYGLGYVLSF